ncbi:MAG: MmcQ/YjbR family DNA-binding protein [Cypionkella sp.]
MSVSVDLDPAFARIEALAASRALPGVERGTSYGTPALRVRTKSFVRLKDAETLVLLCPTEQKTLLMEISPEIYFETDHYIGWPAVLIHLSAISDEELSLRLEDAWRFKAPAKLSAQRPLTPLAGA